MVSSGGCCFCSRMLRKRSINDLYLCVVLNSFCIDVGEAGVAFYIPTNKYSENNSDNANVQGNRERQNKYSYLSIAKLSEKSNMKHLI